MPIRVHLFLRTIPGCRELIPRKPHRTSAKVTQNLSQFQKDVDLFLHQAYKPARIPRILEFNVPI